MHLQILSAERRLLAQGRFVLGAASVDCDAPNATVRTGRGGVQAAKRAKPDRLVVVLGLAGGVLTGCSGDCSRYYEEQHIQSSLVYRASLSTFAALASYQASFGPKAAEPGVAAEGGSDAGVEAGSDPDAGATAESDGGFAAPSVDVTDAWVRFYRGASCADGSTGCLAFDGGGFTVSFARPAKGTSQLAALRAMICEQVPVAPPGVAMPSPSQWQWVAQCVPLQGEIEVRGVDLGCDDQNGSRSCVWFDATLTAQATVDPSQASLSGSITLVDKTYQETQSCGGGFGSFPGDPLQ